MRRGGGRFGAGRRAAILGALGAAALGVALPAHACGVCVEDKMAATYDHEVVQRARSQGRVVVFCDAAGPVEPAALRLAVVGVRGVDPLSLRVSREPAALSFALDPAVQTPEAAVRRLQHSLGGRLHLTVLRTLGGKA